jgi:hypothetical protein
LTSGFLNHVAPARTTICGGSGRGHGSGQRGHSSCERQTVALRKEAARRGFIFSALAPLLGGLLLLLTAIVLISPMMTAVSVLAMSANDRPAIFVRGKALAAGFCGALFHGRAQSNIFNRADFQSRRGPGRSPFCCFFRSSAFALACSESITYFAVCCAIRMRVAHRRCVEKGARTTANS